VYVLALVAVLLLFWFPVRTWFTEHRGRWLYILLFSFLLSFLLVRPFRAFAERVGVLDVPDGRKLHGQPTPLLGGGAIYLAFVLSLVANAVMGPALWTILAGGTCVFIVSLIDDLHPLPAVLKLWVLALSALIVAAAGVSLSLFPSHTLWGQALNLVLTVVWIVGITSATNFFDGTDGLAAGLSAIAAFFLGVIAFQSGQVFLGWVAAALLGSSLGFLPYNFRPGRRATIFLGDAGGNFLGFVLGSVAVMGEWAEHKLVNIAAPVLIFGVFIYDMIYITLDRVVSGRVKSVREWIEYVGRDHLHHRLEAILGRREDAVLFIYALSCSLSIGATILLMASPFSAFLLLVQAVVVLLIVTIMERKKRKPAYGEPTRPEPQGATTKLPPRQESRAGPPDARGGLGRRWLSERSARSKR